MPSENRTQNLGLNQWQGNEYPKRQDFNEDNFKVDEKIAEISESIQNIEVPVKSVNNKTGEVVLNAGDVGAETPLGAQAKANTAEVNAKAYTDIHEQKAAPHSGHETPSGAQAKANAALTSANSYTNQEVTATKGLIGTISGLLTTAKGNLVAAVNEIFNDLKTHKNDNANPHGVTKTQVGLPNVENYAIATQAEAQTGTSNTKYMTPLRTKEAMDMFPAFELLSSATTSTDAAEVAITIPSGYDEVLLVIDSFMHTDASNRDVHMIVNNLTEVNDYISHSIRSTSISSGATTYIPFGSATGNLSKQTISASVYFKKYSNRYLVLSSSNGALQLTTFGAVYTTNLIKVTFILSNNSNGYKIRAGAKFEVWGKII